jgi:hypothetical protein
MGTDKKESDAGMRKDATMSGTDNLGPGANHAGSGGGVSGPAENLGGVHDASGNAGHSGKGDRPRGT